jgi:hypothetical protein
MRNPRQLRHIGRSFGLRLLVLQGGACAAGRARHDPDAGFMSQSAVVGRQWTWGRPDLPWLKGGSWGVGVSAQQASRHRSPGQGRRRLGRVELAEESCWRHIGARISPRLQTIPRVEGNLRTAMTLIGKPSQVLKVLVWLSEVV